MPISAGRDKYPTMTGTHIALYRRRDVLMDSSTVGIPRRLARRLLRTCLLRRGDHRRRRVRPRCALVDRLAGTQQRVPRMRQLEQRRRRVVLQLQPMGDVINVVNGPRDPELGDHGVMDWNTSWDKWVVPADAGSTHGQR